MNGKKALLDTNIVIDLFAGERSVIDLLSEFDELFLPVIVIGELIYGAENSPRKEHHQNLIEAFMERCTTIPIDRDIATQYARSKMELKRKGKPIPENDIWIAATAIALEVDLISNDVHFRQMEIETVTTQ